MLRKIFFMLGILNLFPLVFLSKALTCDTSVATYLPVLNHYHLADCRIVTWPGNFVIPANGHVEFIAEDYIQLLPGFKANKGCYFRTKFRDCITNPTKDSAFSAYGDNDWHVLTAYCFLYGILFESHCPDSWERATKFDGDFYALSAPFYRDASKATVGWDRPSMGGIDEGMLFFHAGHGSPTGFHAKNDEESAISGVWGRANVNDMLLGNCNDGGELRYYWQCSCRTFAHGPNMPYIDDGEVKSNYPLPGLFIDGTSDSKNHRNVYERWGAALAPNLRMACGGSTPMFCHTEETSSVWNRYNNLNYDVADAWLYGMSVSWSFGVTIPLCIARGYHDEDVWLDPMGLDHSFTNKANPWEGSYHIVYIVTDEDSEASFASTRGKVSRFAPEDIPEKMPVFLLEPLPLPSSLRRKKDNDSDEMSFSLDEVEKDGLRVLINDLSGSVYMTGEKKPLDRRVPVLERQKYLELARRFIIEQGWEEEYASEMVLKRTMMQGISVDSLEKAKEVEYQQKAEHQQKNVVIEIRRKVTVEGKLIDVIGNGGSISIQMNNDGSILNASKVWRKIVGSQIAPVKSYKDAYAEAIEKLGRSHNYKLLSWKISYRELAGNFRQDKMAMVYIFEFAPLNRDEDSAEELSPVFITIPGHILE